LKDSSLYYNKHRFSMQSSPFQEPKCTISRSKVGFIGP
jgi:hypothetical protein